ncbi:MAG TPA: hypothetical protein VLE51_03840 [Candidatus Saccharimonadales bacterium]|nr:hypothetical protein [Candidatus Saccharimonadales bacterium]
MRIWGAPKRVKDIATHNPVMDRLAHGRQNAFQRFPLLFTLLATFGVVTTLYGMEHLIDKVSWLANNPVISLVVGLMLLILTGTLYKKL